MYFSANELILPVLALREGVIGVQDLEDWLTTGNDPRSFEILEPLTKVSKTVLVMDAIVGFTCMSA